MINVLHGNLIPIDHSLLILYFTVLISIIICLMQQLWDNVQAGLPKHAALAPLARARECICIYGP